jgi:hypothetical protein
MNGDADHRRTPPLPPFVPHHRIAERRPAGGGLLPPWTSAGRQVGPAPAESTEAFDHAVPAFDADDRDALSAADTPSTERPAARADDWSELFEVETYLSAEAAADLEAYLSENAPAAGAASGEEAASAEARAEADRSLDSATESAWGEPERDEGAEPAPATAGEPVELWSPFDADPDMDADVEPASDRIESSELFMEETATYDPRQPDTTPAPLETWPGEAEAWDAVASTSPEHEPSTGDPGLEALAGRLEAFAAVLRRDGEAGLNRAFASDRLEAALAALIAGHRAARG